jgi:hypothetical protein
LKDWKAKELKLLGAIKPKGLNRITLISNLLTMNVPDVGYFRNANLDI